MTDSIQVPQGEPNPKDPSAFYWLNQDHFPSESERTIIMTGMARSGTSFVASVFGHLGVPMRRHERDKVSGHWEHIALREALVDEEYDRLEEIIADFDRNFPMWGWKAPAIRNDFDAMSRLIRNPCYVFVFKEPLSIAMRKIDRGRDVDFVRHFRRIFDNYNGMLEFASSTDRPCLLVSFDKAVKKQEEVIKVFAKFAGITDYDPAKVLEGVKEDGRNYAKSG